MFISVLRIFAIIATAYVVGKLISKLKLPAILGWLLTGIVFGPYLVGIVNESIIDSTYYKITIKVFETLAGVMIGKEIIFKKLASSGKQIVGITFIQSIGTFIVVSSIFALVLYFAKLPLYLSLIFGGIALATAPAPALSIVNEYHTKGPITDTLIPLAAIDDVIGVIVFFGVISCVSALKGAGDVSVWAIVGMVFLPFVIGIIVGSLMSLLLRKLRNSALVFITFLLGLIITVVSGLLVDIYLYRSFSLNYLLIGMAYSATVANLIKEEKLLELMSKYQPILSVSLLIVIVNLDAFGLSLYRRGGAVYRCLYSFARLGENRRRVSWRRGNQSSTSSDKVFRADASSSLGRLSNLYGDCRFHVKRNRRFSFCDSIGHYYRRRNYK